MKTEERRGEAEYYHTARVDAVVLMGCCGKEGEGRWRGGLTDKVIEPKDRAQKWTEKEQEKKVKGTLKLYSHH